MNLYLKSFKDIQKAEKVFINYFGSTPPVRTTVESNFYEEAMLCQIDGIVYTPQKKGMDV